MTHGKIRGVILFFLFISGIAVFADAKPAANGWMKSETIERLKARQSGAAKPAVRPGDGMYDVSIVSPSGHFRVHYDSSGYNAPDMTDDNGNDIPDYIDAALEYLDYAWDIEVNQLGYIVPISDNGKGGGDEVDCYIREFGSGGYGYTEPDSYFNGPSSAYFFVDNDYKESQYASKGLDGLKVSTAHEFFHVIHFSYIVDLTISWWMEQTAVWMEDYTWSEVNDYFAYLTYFFNDNLTNKTPLDTNTGIYMYGAGIWPMYLVKTYGPDVIKNAWEAFASGSSRSISVLDTVIPGGLAKAYNEFAVWNYFTAHRSNTEAFHTDGDRFSHTVRLEQSVEKTPAYASLGANHMTSRYIEVLFVGAFDENYALDVGFTPEDTGEITGSVIFYNSPQDYRIVPVDGSGAINLEGSWEKAIIVASCTSTSGSNYVYRYDTEITVATDVNDAPPVAFRLDGAYPNPFNPATTIAFTLDKPGDVAVNVYSVTGQKAAVLHDGYMSAGEKRIMWKPEGLAGGVYLVRVAAQNSAETAKVVYVK